MLESKLGEMNKCENKLKELTNKQTANILSDHEIIAMTSTAAARNIDVLQKLGSKVILIEEAAEMMECQTIACLPNSINHLIMIGDHQQLRPKVNNMNSKGLNISLFERMIQNGI